MKKSFTNLEDFYINSVILPPTKNHSKAIVIEASNCSFSIYIPNRDQNSKLIDEVKLKCWIHDFRQNFINYFGCANENYTKSLYKNNNSDIIVEDTKVISAFNFIDDQKYLNTIREIVSMLVRFGYDTNQETVLFVLNNQPNLIRL